MHEVDMTRCLVLSMEEWRARHAPAVPRVERLHLQVGDFTCVEPEALCFTWAAAVEDSWLAGAELAITTVPLVARCLPCGATYSPDPERGYRSPCCDQPMEEIVSGRELRIRSVEYAYPEAEAGGPAATPATRKAPQPADTARSPAESPGRGSTPVARSAAPRKGSDPAPTASSAEAPTPTSPLALSP